MFTLKLAHTGSSEASATWISGISTVHLLDISTKEASRDVWASYFEPRDSIIDHTGFLSGDRDVALLCVIYENGFDRYIVCGRAWLLGPNGETIERITP